MNVADIARVAGVCTLIGDMTVLDIETRDVRVKTVRRRVLNDTRHYRCNVLIDDVIEYIDERIRDCCFVMDFDIEDILRSVHLGNNEYRMISNHLNRMMDHAAMRGDLHRRRIVQTAKNQLDYVYFG